MYYYTWYGYNPQKKLDLTAPKIQSTEEISVVIPVRNNQLGINCFLRGLFGVCESGALPLEVIVVQDHGSPIEIPKEYEDTLIEVKVVSSEGYGPASARNTGYKEANGSWILFTDSDCIPSPTFLSGYLDQSNGAIGYAGTVKSLAKDRISSYYEDQRILMPSGDSFGCPEYLITANSLVWRRALDEVGGFEEEITIAAGEDVDLGFRLRGIGSLSFADSSIVYHDFNDGLLGFIHRFARYGRGNHELSSRYSLNIKPRPFKPAKNGVLNSTLASLQYLSMLYGWYSNNHVIS